MKIAVIGAGAIGGMLGVKLAAQGHELSVLLRGANLAAVRARGMSLIEESGQRIDVQQIGRASCRERVY